MNFSSLIAYFEDMASRHVEIRHSDARKHFFRMEIDEVLGGFNRSDSEFPMLILEGYGFSYTDNRSDNVLKNRTGAFILLGALSDATDYNAKHELWDYLESIGDDILARMREDKRNRNPVIRGFELDKVEATLILNEFSNCAGIRYTFTITAGAPVAVDPTRWITD